MHRTGAFTKPTRDDHKPVSPSEGRLKTRRNAILAVGSVMIAVAAAWALWPAEVVAPGRLVLSLNPSVPGELFIDGKKVGAIPPFVWQVERGPHRVEIRAEGYKPFHAKVKIPSSTKPAELQVALVTDGPAEVDGAAAEQKDKPVEPAEVVPREPSRGRQSAKPPKNEDSAPAERAVPAPEPQRNAPDQAARNDAPSRPARDRPSNAVKEPAPRPARAEVAKAEPAAAIALAPAEDRTDLRIATTPPGAEIVIDNQPAGKSPLSVPNLDMNNVHIVAISMAGYRSERRVAKADDGRFAPLNLTLLPTPQIHAAAPASDALTPPTPAAPSAPSTQGSPAITPPAAVADADPPAGPIGYLVTMTKPVAKVFIDGKDTGRWTPVVPKYPISLPPGRHTVTFETTEGHRQDEPINIEAGKTSRVIRMDL